MCVRAYSGAHGDFRLCNEARWGREEFPVRLSYRAMMSFFGIFRKYFMHFWIFVF